MITAAAPRADEPAQTLSEAPARTIEPAAPVDEMRVARVTVAGKTQVLAANVRGEFQRLTVPASATISASVPFAGAEPGEVIPVQAEDGGQLQGLAAQGMVIVDSDHKVALDYQVSADDGLHRVTLRRGGESRVLEFWVGAEPAVLVRK